MMTQPNTVFTTELIGDTLVVTPQGDSTGFRYNDIHSETNAVITAIDRQGSVLKTWGCGRDCFMQVLCRV
jgi:hypothetical protein